MSLGKQLKEAITSQGTENPAMAFFRKEPLLFLQGIEEKISRLAWGDFLFLVLR
jgi:hypothetical protein